MKIEESTSDKHGDISPISGSISNLAESAPVPEPTSERLTNFARVTPAQMIHISFPSDGRYQPVRAVSSYTSRRVPSNAFLASEKYAGGGGILIMMDSRPNEEQDYIEFTTASVPQETTSTVSRDRHISLNESAPEADPPEPFEVSLSCHGGLNCADTWCSILSTAIRKINFVDYLCWTSTKCCRAFHFAIYSCSCACESLVSGRRHITLSLPP